MLIHMEKDRLEGAIIEEPEEVPTSSLVLVAQFFVVPVIIVALCFGIFVLFGLITGENRSARDYLEEVKGGNGSRRWQAAFELSKYISSKGNKPDDARLAKEISVAYRNAKDDDPRIRQYLALAMGTLQDNSAVEPLLESLDRSNDDTQLYAVWALGRLGDRRAVEPLMKLVESSDRDIRKMAVYSLGMLQDSKAVPILRVALNDKNQDVSWNAALALARMRDASGLDILHQMLDRNRLNALHEVNEVQKSEAIINAAHAVVLLKDSTARTFLEEIRRNDPDVKARSAAIDALKEIP